MTSFVQIKEGDTVFDRIQEVTGVVTGINYKTNVAEIKVDTVVEVEFILCKLFNLTVVGKPFNPPNNNKWYHQVKEFHEAFDHPIADCPTPIELDRFTSRSVWIGEEVVEGIQASSNNKEEFIAAYDVFIEGLQKAKEKSLKEDFNEDGTSKVVAQADSLVDALYFILGSFVELGIEPDKLFDAVQLSNMSKLFTDEEGNKFAKYRESDGKILKSDNFFPPEPALLAEIERQSKLK